MSDRKNIIFDSQILNKVQMCGHATYLNFVQNLLPAEGFNENLEEGDLLHHMKELYNRALQKYRYDIIYSNENFKALVEASVEYGTFVSTSMSLQPAEVDETIYNFIEHCKYTRQDGVEILEVERPFIKQIFKDDELGVFYTGKIDRYTNTPNFGHVPRDYKKAKQRREPEHLSNQFTGYCVATDSNIIIIDKVGFQKTLPPEERFQEYPLYYNQFQKDEWIRDTVWWARQYAFYIEENTWPRNRTSCDKYTGCNYRILCDATDEEVRQHLIKTKFIIGDEWDPTQFLNKGKKELDSEQKMMLQIANSKGFELEI